MTAGEAMYLSHTCPRIGQRHFRQRDMARL
jgi:hypothetical protein